MNSAIEIAARVRKGKVTARKVIEQTLADIHARNPLSNSFTLVTSERALKEADAIDALKAQGKKLPPLAGVPFAVKNLFDIENEITVAGSIVNRMNRPAMQDATLIKQLPASGAVLVGALNMDEYAYGFTTENTHYGACKNPHDRQKIAGGSSGGCGAAIADELVPLALGSDTNGSIRVPSSLCGVFGLKPTFGRLSRSGSFPFSASLDHLGPFAKTLEDLALCYDQLQCADEFDPACANRAKEAVLHHLPSGRGGLRIARLGGYFEEFSGPVANLALKLACTALNVNNTCELPLAKLGRAAAFIITGNEGGSLHASNLRKYYDRFEPLSRDRFVAGSLIPGAWYQQAQRVRALYAQQANELFRDVDVLLAPATPITAPDIGTQTICINGNTLPARASLGLLTQPISCIGLPVVTVPIPVLGQMPIGIQVIAAPWKERDAFLVAAELVRQGVGYAHPLPQ